MLITTTKDIVRVPAHLRDSVAVLKVEVAWEDEAALLSILAPAAARKVSASPGLKA